MTQAFRFFRIVKIKMVCADTTAMLHALSGAGIALSRIRYIDELTTEFYLKFGAYLPAISIIKKHGGRIIHTDYDKISYLLNRLFHRPVLVVGVLLLIGLTLYLPSRVLFISVQGNSSIPVNLIEEAAAECGIRFGASRQWIRSEKTKNELLSKIPALKWVGVNTKGCVAEISVRERVSTGEMKVPPAISSIVASRDGVISEMTVTSGEAVGKVGQAVAENDLLISGYSDCGRCIYGTQAQGEVYAQTRRTLTAILPISSTYKETGKGESKKISLLLGKKRINFYKGSGIYDTTCVKMYTVCPLVLPGGWELPLALITETYTDRASTPASRNENEISTILEQCSRDYLKSQMIAGRIDSESVDVGVEDDKAQLTGSYICHEMIGQTRIEEIIEHYGEDNRENCKR